MEKILLTGSTGLIGKEALKSLEKSGLEVLCLSSKSCNLFNKTAVSEYISETAPDYLLHFAWITGGDYLSNPLNYDYCDSSLNLLESFYENGGKRAVFSGTCFEYDFKDTLLKETDRLNPKTLYAQKKNELNERAFEFCLKKHISYAWGRIFYVYGHNEKEGRLTSSIINNLKENKTVTVKYGQLIRDYMYTKDIASAFATLLLSNVQGNVNICTGKGISLEKFAIFIAKEMNKEELLDIHYEDTTQPITIIGDAARLKNEVGFAPMFSYESAIKKIIREEC